jgi:hypothetical protein
MTSNDKTLTAVQELKRFIETATHNWEGDLYHSIRSIVLPNNTKISCVCWRGTFYITGTDIVKCIVFLFSAAGRPILARKKFEEGVFSDLRNVKVGQGAILENAHSSFLSFLFQNNCIRTQKKQKVFEWSSVPIAKFFADAVERESKRIPPRKVSVEDRVSSYEDDRNCKDPEIQEIHKDPQVYYSKMEHSKRMGELDQYQSSKRPSYNSILSVPFMKNRNDYNVRSVINENLTEDVLRDYLQTSPSGPPPALEIETANILADLPFISPSSPTIQYMLGKSLL